MNESIKMNKKIIAAFCLFLLLLSFTACESAITEGEVYKKEFKEAHTQLVTLPLTISNGKTVQIITVPYIIRYPDRYIVYIKSFQDDEWAAESFYVTPEVYDRIGIGDMYEYDEDRGDLKEEPYTREKGE